MLNNSLEYCTLYFIEQIGLHAVLGAVVVEVGTAGDIAQPGFVAKVPVDSFAEALFEGHGRLPTEFAVDFGGVDGVALVVARAVLDKGDESGAVALGAAELGVHGAAQ